MPLLLRLVPLRLPEAGKMHMKAVCQTKRYTLRVIQYPIRWAVWFRM